MDGMEQWKAKLLDVVEQGKGVMQDVVAQAQLKIKEIDIQDMKQKFKDFPDLKQKIKENPDVQLYIAASVIFLTILVSLLCKLSVLSCSSLLVSMCIAI